MANMPMPLSKAIEAVKTLNDVLPNSPDLQKRHLWAQAFLMLDENGKTLFGFSKFVGCGVRYNGNPNSLPNYYLNNYRKLNGVGITSALKNWGQWLREVPIGSGEYKKVHKEFITWAMQHGAQLEDREFRFFKLK